MRKWLTVLLFLACGGVTADTGEDMQRAALRAKLALMRVHTAVAPDRGIVVSGPRAEGNALLLQAVQQIRSDLESLLGLPLPVSSSQHIRLQVMRDDAEPLQAFSFDIKLEWLGGVLVHRIELPNYLSSYAPEARENVVYAMLRMYCMGNPQNENLDTLPSPPAWFWQGVLGVLDADSRNLILAQIDRRWRAGQVPPLGTFFREAPREELSAEERIVAGAIIYWLASRLYSDDFFAKLFAEIRLGRAPSFTWLRDELGQDPDELFDRWLLAQGHTVRAVGAVMMQHIESLRELLYVYPGLHGVPRRANVQRGVPLSMLAAYRDADWFDLVVQERRKRLQLIRQGRHVRMQDVIALLLEVVNGVANGAKLAVLREQENKAHVLLEALAEDVKGAGGILREEE